MYSKGPVINYEEEGLQNRRRRVSQVLTLQKCVCVGGGEECGLSFSDVERRGGGGTTSFEVVLKRDT